MRAAVAIGACSLLLCGAATAAGQFDGSYHGRRTVEGARNRRCDEGGPLRVVVAGNAVRWARSRTERASIPIAPDGSFSGQNGRRFIQGRIDGATMTAHVKGEYCDYGWSLTR